jgi:hypothetical protein
MHWIGNMLGLIGRSEWENAVENVVSGLELLNLDDECIPWVI